MEWTGARFADRPSVEVSVHIEAPPERVWDVVADPLGMPALSSELQAVEWLDGATDASVGARFSGRNHHPALGEWTTTSHVVECDPPHRFAWAVEDPDRPGAIWRFTLTEEDGGTRLSHWMQIGPGPSGVTVAIEAMPDKEEKIIFVRLREHEAAMTRTLEGIRTRVEATGR